MITLTLQDILFAAVLAFALTWLIMSFGHMIQSVWSKPTEFDYLPKDMNKVLQKCYHLFPRDIVQFHGETFRRGMKVRVRTNQHKIFEGQLIGLNNENMLCVLTNRYIVAHELDKIEEMNILC
ncbi:MAG: hypothetical protein LBT44_00425 [Clostridiales bacterium]|nr:hypothetical protein [Clostridiales bacterium]